MEFKIVHSSDLSFKIGESVYSLEELVSAYGNYPEFAEWLSTTLRDRGVKLRKILKNGREVYSPLRTIDGFILKIKVDLEGKPSKVVFFKSSTDEERGLL